MSHIRRVKKKEDGRREGGGGGVGTIAIQNLPNLGLIISVVPSSAFLSAVDFSLVSLHEELLGLVCDVWYWTVETITPDCSTGMFHVVFFNS